MSDLFPTTPQELPALEQADLLQVPVSRNWLHEARLRYEKAKDAYAKAEEAVENSEVPLSIPKEIQWELSNAYRNLAREEKAELAELQRQKI